MTCPYGFNGSGSVARHADGSIEWTQADPEVHASDEVVQMPIFLAKYEVVASCQAWPGTQHARLR